MQNLYHILNGDALLDQFPKSIKGEKIILRECLVEGDVQGDSFESFCQVRADYLQQAYGQIVDVDYHTEVVPEFEKILAIPQGSVVNLWFEDDLFCQVNFWFALHLLAQTGKEVEAYLVRPEEHTEYGFGYYEPHELVWLLKTRVSITALEKLSQLWLAYQANDLAHLREIASGLDKEYPFIANAVQAHLDRIPSKNNPGKPKMILSQIMNELDTEDFGEVFQEFNHRASIYGFGDLQVKRLFDELIDESS